MIGGHFDGNFIVTLKGALPDQGDDLKEAPWRRRGRTLGTRRGWTLGAQYVGAQHDQKRPDKAGEAVWGRRAVRSSHRRPSSIGGVG